MSDVAIPYRFLCRGGTAAAIAALNEIPRARELIVETDTLKFKFGDGVTHYNSLDYAGILEAVDIPYDNAAGGLTATNVQTALDELVDEKLDDAPVDGTNYGRKDGAWQAITGGGGSGDVVGPASSVANHVALFDGTTGKLLKDSGLTLSGTNTGDETAASVATLIHAASSKATAVDADELPLADSAASFGLKKLTLANLWTYISGKVAALYAPLASPALTGSPTAPNQSAGDNSTKLANTAYVDTAISSLTGSGATDIRDVWLFG